MKTFRRSALATAIAGSLVSGGAIAVNLATDGIGEVAIAPFYTVRDGWSTLINLTNTQDVPLVVKVRIHEGLNSRDVFDFNVAMSAFDVFTAVIQEDAQGFPVFISTDVPNDQGDTTCTIPSSVGESATGFPLSTLGYASDSDPDDNDEGPTDADRLREGYIEFIVMGYTLPSTTIGDDIEDHDCGALDTAFEDVNILSTAQQFGEPINALKFNFRLLNPARGVEAGNTATTWANFFNPGNGSGATGNTGDLPDEVLIDPDEFLVIPSDNASCTITRGDERTDSQDNPPSADWIPGEAPGTGSCQNLITAQQDFAFLEPSLADAYPPEANWWDDTFDTYVTALPVGDSLEANGDGTFERGIDAVSATIMRDKLINEWSNNNALGVTTDWIVTQPTKGFYVDADFGDITASQNAIQAALNEQRLASVLDPSDTDNPADSEPDGFSDVPYPPYQRAWAVPSGETFASACNDVSFVFYDRAEQTVVPQTGGVIPSPAPPTPVELDDLCYELSIVSFNGQSAFAEPALNRIDIDTSGLPAATAGWMLLQLDEWEGARLPMDFAASGSSTNFSVGKADVTAANGIRGLPVIGFNLKVRNFGSADANYASTIDHGYTRSYSDFSPPVR